MADVIFSEVLCFLNKNMKRFDKSTVHDIIAKFYHEDELYDAKAELCKVVAAAQPDAMPPDGWAKFVNSKGVPVNRRMSDAVQRRRAEADDLMQMLMLLDVNKVILPKFVIADPDRVPNGVWAVTSSGSSEIGTLMSAVQDIVSQFTTTMNTVMQRLGELESKLTPTESMLNSVQSRIPEDRTTGTIITPTPYIATDVRYRESATTSNETATTSWAEQARGLTDAGANLVFSNRKPPVRVRMRGQASTGPVKGVPRQLTCFASRLHIDVTEEELTNFPRGQGIMDVECRKVVAKDGRKFRTSAFRVSCSSRYESVLYDESKWPEGVELRDWVFYGKNGSQ